MNPDTTATGNVPPYPETADIETSSEDYARRFAGGTGQWFLQRQADIVISMMNGAQSAAVLDVGGGHGQLAHPLCKEGRRPMVVGSSPECCRAITDLVDAESCSFQVANVLSLPFGDRSFDSVLCFRLLPHCEQWPELIGELCRVAGNEVILDYPTSQSSNAIAPLLFGLKKRVEGNTRRWRLFRHAEISDVFAINGFETAKRMPQFLLPMVLHRALRCRALSVGIEAVCKALGLTRLWGSPVIIQMKRKTDSTEGREVESEGM